jgi:ribosomal protein L18E
MTAETITDLKVRNIIDKLRAADKELVQIWRDIIYSEITPKQAADSINAIIQEINQANQ